MSQRHITNKKQSKLIPVMYHECELPSHLACYSKLRYLHPQKDVKPPYNFWERLSNSLCIIDRPRSNSSETTHSKLKIVKESNMTNGYQVSQVNGYNNHLALPEIPKKSLSCTSISEVKKKIYGALNWVIKPFRGKKYKKAIAVAN